MIQIIKENNIPKATVRYEKNGVTAHFSKSVTPEFIAQAGEVIDRFMWSKEEDRPPIVDVFEKQENGNNTDNKFEKIKKLLPYSEYMNKEYNAILDILNKGN